MTRVFLLLLCSWYIICESINNGKVILYLDSIVVIFLSYGSNFELLGKFEPAI